MPEKDVSKPTRCTRLRCTLIILAVLVLLTSTVVLATVFILRAKSSTNSSTMPMSQTLAINQTRQISIRGLLTVDTAAQANVCGVNQSIADCVLVYNAQIFMNALALLPTTTTDNSSESEKVPENNSSTPIDCKGMRIRRNQLSQIFEPQTLQTIFKLSGVPYSAANDSLGADTSSSTRTGSQIDARAGQNRWSSPINYYISTTTGFTPPMIATIHLAIANWQNNTCLTFNELTVITPTTNSSYILFERDDVNGCSSPVSYDPTDPTSDILISLTCGVIIGSVMHEIGHTLGYIHTQSRTDRNSYVNIVSANIDPIYAGNFFIWSYGTLTFPDVTLPYDFGSFMHYDAYGFSNNGRRTIVSLDSRYGRTMGQRQAASFYDYKSINRLYCVQPSCPQMFANNGCQNSGYLDPRTCTRCICPEGFGGTFCDQIDPNSNCGGIITNPSPSIALQQTITSPFPTTISPQTQYCVYQIRSQSAGKIRLSLNSINTLDSSVCDLTSMIEVRYQSDLSITGARWCGNTVPTAWLNVTAQSNTMVVMFRANNYFNVTTGTPQASFSATIFFDAEPGTTTPQPVITAPPATTTTTTLAPVPTTIAAVATSTCPPASFRCQLPSQPTCGGCLNYQPCQASGTQQCTAYTNVIQLTGCNQIVNGAAQCQYSIVQVPFLTNCQRQILLCCPSYQLVAFQSQYYCTYNAQATNLPSEWSLVI